MINTYIVRNKIATRSKYFLNITQRNACVVFVFYLFVFLLNKFDLNIIQSI